MAQWYMREHLVNAALWGIVGSSLINANFLSGIPFGLRLGVLALLYSYSADLIDGALPTTWQIYTASP